MSQKKASTNSEIVQIASKVNMTGGAFTVTLAHFNNKLYIKGATHAN
jgi:hypothetical protein